MKAEIKSEIADFYANKHIFITGATGYMGKVLVEKLMRSCPKIAQIFILVRMKKGKSTKERKEEMWNGEVLSTVRKQNPELYNKLIVVTGDVSHDNIGLSEEDEKKLIDNVEIVFHCAATVRFDEPLKTCLINNFTGTKGVLELCHKIKKLQAFVHTSTAYSNCDRDHIEEITYPPPFSPSSMICCLDVFDDNLFEALGPHFVGKKPNTYIFAKSMAEGLVAERRGDLPVAIVRPSIVVPSAKEPHPGWIDNYNGPAGLSMAVGRGVLRSFPVDVSKVVDFMPADLSINMLVAVGWYTAVHKPKQLMVYNNTSGSLNPITWGKYGYWACIHYLRNPMIDTLWYPSTKFLNSPVTHRFYDLFLHYLPAKVGDFVLGQLGKKPVMMKLYRKLNKVHEALEFFTVRQWSYDNDNVNELIECMSKEDRVEFNCDIRILDWKTYISHAILGGVKYLGKLNFQHMPMARKRLRKLKILHHSVELGGLIILLLVLAQLFFILFPAIANTISDFMYYSNSNNGTCSNVSNVRYTSHMDIVTSI